MTHAYKIIFTDKHGENSMYLEAKSINEAIHIFEVCYPDFSFVAITV
jgi:hypothetical protein